MCEAIVAFLTAAWAWIKGLFACPKPTPKRSIDDIDNFGLELYGPDSRGCPVTTLSADDWGDMIPYGVMSSSLMSNDFLQLCVNLFNTSFGKWGPGCPEEKLGQQITTTVEELRQNFAYDEHCFVSYGRASPQNLVGYAFFRRFPYMTGEAIWLTQLVVAPECEGTVTHFNALIRAAVGASAKPPVAIGIATSRPTAIRSLETIAKLPVLPGVVAMHGSPMIAASKVPRLQGLPVEGCSVKTNFFVDQSEAQASLEQMEDWVLGDLLPGYEFVGIVTMYQ